MNINDLKIELKSCDIDELENIKKELSTILNKKIKDRRLEIKNSKIKDVSKLYDEYLTKEHPYYIYIGEQNCHSNIKKIYFVGEFNIQTDSFDKFIDNLYFLSNPCVDNKKRILITDEKLNYNFILNEPVPTMTVEEFYKDQNYCSIPDILVTFILKDSKNSKTKFNYFIKNNLLKKFIVTKKAVKYYHNPTILINKMSISFPESISFELSYDNYKVLEKEYYEKIGCFI